MLVPFPPRRDGWHGGARVAAGLAERLAARHELALFYLRGRDEPPAGAELVRAVAVVQEIRHRNRSPSRLRLLGGTPSLVHALDVPELRRRLVSFVPDWTPDVVQIEYATMAQYVSALRGCSSPRVLVEHDPAVRAARDIYDRSRGLKRLRAAAEWRAWHHHERAAFRQMDAIVVFTDDDVAGIRALHAEVPVVRIPFATAIPSRPLNAAGRPPATIVFVGSFVHPPNIDAACRLSVSILPRLTGDHPELRLAIVGHAPPDEVRALAGARVEVFADVPDVTPFLDRAAVVVAPLRMGGGMRVKVLEALAAGKAVVASPLAVKGLHVEHGREVLIADTDEALADAIGTLLVDTDRRIKLATAARAWASAYVSWGRTVASYESLYASLTRGARASRFR